jgi:hypothetical protein
VPDLLPISPNPPQNTDGSYVYALTSVDKTHQGNGRYHHNQYYLTTLARQNLRTLIDSFALEGWGTVALNDASLHWGGRRIEPILPRVSGKANRLLENGAMTMNITQTLRTVLSVIAFGANMAYAQDSASFDAQKGIWNLHYQDPETAQWVNKTYVARTAIKPIMESNVSGHGWPFFYQYTVRNQRDARQNISVIQVWGIPLVYTIPNLPPVTANAHTNSELEDKQQWAQLKVKRSFERSVVKAPKGWSPGLRVDEAVNQTSFVWTPGLKDTDSNGVEPGRAQSGFIVLRPELPGVARTYLQGRIAEPWGLDGVPQTPFWTQKVAEIEDQDYLLVPVLAPVITVPDPYNSAELARRIKAHVQTWLKYGHLNADMLARLNRQFDVLIPALERGNKQAARAAVEAIRQDCADRHPGFRDEHIDLDDGDHGARAMPRTPAQRSADTPKVIDRVAVRALAFDLRYIVERLNRS